MGYRIEGLTEQRFILTSISGKMGSHIVEVLETVDYALIDASFFADGELGNRDMSQIPHPSFQKPWRCLRKAAQRHNKICLYI